MKISAVIKLILISIGFVGYCTNSNAAYNNDIVTQLHSIRIWVSPENTRLVFDVNKDPSYRLQTLEKPNRIVIDFPNSKLNAKLVKDLRNPVNRGSIKRIQTLVEKDKSRIILYLNYKVLVNHFTLKPNERYPYRLVLDLESCEKQKILAWFDLDFDKKKHTQTALTAKVKPNSSNILAENQVKSTQPISKPLIIAIDPGHGGEDPGAIGFRGTLEKDVVLAIAKKLEKSINSLPSIRAFLTREGDYYISLSDRILKARKRNADLLLSIHADAFSNTKADGASVFVLSPKGASSAAAKWLADSQNKSDLIGGVRITNKKDILASVLLDLSQTANYTASVNAAQSILTAMSKDVGLHKFAVEHASFAVLKAPDVPSVLIETGFISNPSTELKLRDPKYQQLIVSTVMRGIHNYFKLDSKI